MSSIKTRASLELPAWLDPEAWDAFVEMRSAKGKRAPFTSRAQMMLLNKLHNLRAGGHDPNECLRESVMNGWSGVFPVHNNQKTATTPPKPWFETRSGIEAKGESLGLGRWDEGAWGVGRGESFGEYAARVKRKASAEGVA